MTTTHFYHSGKLVILLVQYAYTKCYAYLRELLCRLL